MHNFAVLVVVAAIGLPVPAIADNPLDTPVADRKRAEYEPSGLRAGAFVVYPSVAVRYVHDDNLFADAVGKIDDSIIEYKPAIALESDWTSHWMRVGVDATFGRYADQSAEDYDDLAILAEGRLDITRSSRLKLTARRDSLHQHRYSPDDANGLTPTEFNQDSLAASYERSAGRLPVQLTGKLLSLDYQDTPVLSGQINNDDRDREEILGTARIGLARGGDSVWFVQGQIDSRNYDEQRDDEGLTRNSQGYAIALGAALDFVGPFALEGFVGNIRRDYDDPQFDTIDSIWFGGKLIWHLTAITSLTALAESSIEETTVAGASGIYLRKFGVAVDHELRRNLILHVDTDVWQEDFKDSNREDDLLRASFGANYLINRHLRLMLRYDWRKRSSAQTPARPDDYEINEVSLQVTAQY
ncbi:MAG: outer membrane beta-barrel protein [Gammaproteobacteria bacterium]|nr:outer membrane beta-barrel protein [Gammaproteobacteria bacterium]MDH3767667.1 outer membrane beta-barrel protein [Gammaproteobacteria bacterium]